MTECICKGNLQKLVEQYQDKFGSLYKHKDKTYVFKGILISDDDYYYSMVEVETRKSWLLSCVGDIEGFDFKELV